MKTRLFKTMTACVLLTASAGLLQAQTASLYVTEPMAEIAPPPNAAPVSSDPFARPVERALSPALRQASLMAVALPEPRQFAVNDLVTIIVRESAETDLDGSLETEKEMATKGGFTTVPDIGNLEEYLKRLQLDVDASKEFEGDGTYTRSGSMVTRMTAKIIDVKPNGTLVLEARKFIRADDEEQSFVVTGICRAEDITIDNTVLSTQIYDLHINEQHKGEIRKSTEKGLFTKIIEGLFAF